MGSDTLCTKLLGKGARELLDGALRRGIDETQWVNCGFFGKRSGKENDSSYRRGQLTKKTSSELSSLLTFFQMWFCSLDQGGRSLDIDKEIFIEVLLIDFA